MRRIWRAATSLKTSLALMVLLATLLLLSLLLPQEHLVGERGIDAISAQSAIKRFLLVKLGFGDMPSSPVFLGSLVLFFGNLAAVLGARAATTLKRIRRRELSSNQLRRRAERDDALRLARPIDWRDADAAALLRRLGYRVSRPGNDTLFAEKHRTGLLGFLVFHLSFFPICAGGLMLYYTRFTAKASLTEGQTYTAELATVHRHAPLGGADDLSFSVVEISPELEDGKPKQLTAHIELDRNGETVRKTARVNHPANNGHVDVLIANVGVAPVFRLRDAAGVTTDLVTVRAPQARAGMSLVPLASGELELELDPIPIGPDFPERAQLDTTAISLRVFSDDAELFAGSLRPGEAAQVGDHSLVLQEVRYWGGFLIVAERGGWLLIVGFALAVTGLVWRMVLVRRELGLVWYDDEIVIFGTSEFYRGRFRDELHALGELLVQPPAPPTEKDQ